MNIALETTVGKITINDKHAYLVIAHNQPELLCCLLKALDHNKNDIYLHLDRKMQYLDEAILLELILRGNLYILSERLDVKWGDYSQIQCELNLLEAATKEQHAYYHLMSGVDFPLKPQEQIHRFFWDNSGIEFVQFQSRLLDRKTKNKVSKYHFIIKRNADKTMLDRLLGKLLLFIQLPVDRTRHMNITLQKGANWFSITDELARYVLSKKEFIQKVFRYTLCGDEIFLQTLVYNSEFLDRVVGENYCDNYSNIQYCIDWERGKPYEYTNDDYDDLVQSGMLFARKFNWNKDKKIVQRLLEEVAAGN